MSGSISHQLAVCLQEQEARHARDEPQFCNLHVDIDHADIHAQAPFPSSIGMPPQQNKSGIYMYAHTVADPSQ